MLKKINIQAEPAVATAKLKEPKPRVTLPGNPVQLYATAVSKLKTAIEAKAFAERAVIDKGVRLAMKHNLANPTLPVTSVEVSDSTGALAQVQLKNQYGSITAEAISSFFEHTFPDLDVNDYVHEVLTTSFDSSVFMRNAKFDASVYLEFKKAIEAVASKLGVESPLSTKKVVTFKPNFHTTRWTEFKTLDAQLALHEALPAATAGKVLEN